MIIKSRFLFVTESSVLEGQLDHPRNEHGACSPLPLYLPKCFDL